jgi:phytoene dehydrogenase-like protein
MTMERDSGGGVRGVPDPAALRATYDAVVVGCGHNGLVAAAYLVRAGLSVLLLERAPEVGGATVSRRLFPGVDARVSRYAYLVSLLPDCVVHDLQLPFTTRRRAVASFTPWSDPSGGHGGLLVSNVDESRSRQAFRELTGGDAEWQGYQRFLRLQQALAAVAWPSLTRPLAHRSHFLASLDTAEAKAAWDAFVERPIGEAIEAHMAHDLVRGLVLTDAKIGVFSHAHDPSLLQNRCFLYHVIGRGTGEWRVPVGGMQALVDALLAACARGDASLAVRAEATRIHPGGDRHDVEFTLDGRSARVAARHVLVAASPRILAGLLGEPWSPRPADEGAAVKVNMLLERLPRLRAAVAPEEAFCGSLHVDEGYRGLEESYRTAAAGRLPDPAPAEVYCHTLTDDSILGAHLRGRGCHTLTLFGLDVPYRLFAADPVGRRDAILARYLAGLDRICAEPLADCLAHDAEGRPCLEVKTPVDLEVEVGLDQGNIFHDAPSWFFTDDPAEVGTWGVETRHPGILVAGSAARRGGAVSGIPGRAAALAVLAERGLEPPG